MRVNSDEKICPRCAETVKAAAKVCRYCGHEFSERVTAATPTSGGPAPSTWLPPKPSPVQSQNESTSTTSKAAIGCVGIVVALLLMGQCIRQLEPAAVNSDANTLAPPSEVSTNADIGANIEPKPSSDWTSSTATDELRGKPVHHAAVSSENSAEFDFPYGGGSTLTMTVRRHPKYGEDVIFQISKGQFVCGVYDCSGTINFGSSAQGITLNRPADHSSDTLFVSGAASVISKLKKADKVIVELPFYQEGNRQFTFRTKGLVWPPK